MNKPAPHQPTATLVGVVEPKLTETRLLVLNAVSSSLKFALFEKGEPLVRICSGNIERIGSPEAVLTLKGIDGQPGKRPGISAPDHITGLDYLLSHLAGTTGRAAFSGVGHRVVHGGSHYRDPQLACFDTAFHHDLPRVGKQLQIPRRYEERAFIVTAFTDYPTLI